MATPPADVQSYIVGPHTVISRRVEVLNSDGTYFSNDAPILGGQVTISNSRSERRTFQLDIDNGDGAFDHYPGGFWYDKIIRIYRGVAGGGYTWETQIGEFLIDSITEPHFPRTLTVSGRDYTKKLLTAKFIASTEYASGYVVADLIKVIAQNGGITRFNLQRTKNNGTTPTTGKPFVFERGVERWKAITDIATAYGFEVFFDAAGYLTTREFRDPVTSPEVFTFQSGADSNLVSFTKSANDSRLYNSVVVTGEASDQVPVYYNAKNTEPTSPTRIAAIGERLYTYTSSFITTVAQAQEVANNFLKVHALEQFEISLESIVIPWLEVGEIVRFHPYDDEGNLDLNPGEPDRYLLTDLTIPLALGSMSATGKRVTLVQ